MAASGSRDSYYADELHVHDDQDEDSAEEQEEERERSEKTDTPRVRLKDAELQGYADLLGEQMVREKLTKAQKMYDVEVLGQALEEFNELGLETDDSHQHARAVYYDVCSYKKLLREARHLKDPDPKLIEDRLTAVKRNRLEKYLRDEVEKCEVLLKRLNVKEKKRTILAMDKKTMAEMKSYSKPSALVRRIMTAALLLLGEDEDTTSRWPKVQSLCNPDGREGMVRRMMNFDARDLHADIVARVQYLIKDITLAQAQKASPGAATFYVWTKRVIGDDPEAETERGDTGTAYDDAGERNKRDDNVDDDDVDDDDKSIFNEEDEYERNLRAAERKKEDLKYYQTTLAAWISKEKKIFAEQKKRKEEQKRAVVAPRPRPVPNQAQPRSKPSNLRYL